MFRNIEQPVHWSQRLTQIALGLAIALVIARASMVQILREPQLAIPGTELLPRVAGPTSSLILDLLLCVPAMLVLLRRAIDRDYQLNFRVSPLIFGGLSILAAVSVFWSSDKFATLITAADFVAAAALFWAMSQLVRTWVDLRLVGGACFGILLVLIAQGLLYRLVDLPDNIEFWEKNKAEELARRNWEPGSFAAMRFEQMVRAGSMTGFSTSPNTYAAMVVMLGVVTAGMVIQRFYNRDEPAWAVSSIIALLITAGVLYFTYSRAALITPFIAAALLIIAPRMAGHRKGFYVLCAGVFVAGTIALVVYGLMFDSLVIQTLTYRWHYWYGAIKILEQHPLLGIGWSNFGAYYLGVRLPVASEEVKDPHNMVIRALVELGVIGGAMITAWLARLAWELVTSPPALMKTHAPRPNPHSAGVTIASICLGGILINILCSVDFVTPYAGGAWFIAMEIFKRMLFFGLLLLGYAGACLESSRRPHLDDRAAPWLSRAMIAGVAVFLVHNLIDFALFEPGALCLFAMLGGAALSVRTNYAEKPVVSRTIPIAACAIAGILWIAVLIGLVIPVANAEHYAQSGDDLVRAGQASIAAEALEDAFESLWLTNADYAYRAAVAMQYTPTPADRTRAMLEAAVRTNPMSVLYRRARAQFEIRQPMPDSRRIMEDFEAAIEMDPNDVSAHVDFADALVRLGQRQRAIEEYRTALKYDDLLEKDEPKRMPPAKIAEIEQKIRALQG